MSSLTDTFEIPLREEQAERSIKDALAQIGWGIEEQGAGKIVPRLGAGLTRNPSKIEVTWIGAASATTVELNGRIMGIGPVQKRHLRATMNRLRNAIEAASPVSQ